MKNLAALFLFPLLALALSGCGNNDGGGGGGGTEPPMVVACTADGSNITAAKANNYSFTSTLTFPPVKVKPSSELNFDWSAVTKDFLGHSVNAANDLTLISVLSWNLNLQKLEEGLNADTLLQKDLTVVPLTLTTDGNTTGVAKGATSAKLYTFTLNGGPVTSDQIAPYFDINNYPPQYTTYTLMAATGVTVGQNVKMIQSFLLDSGSSNTDVKMTDTSTHLTYSANMHSATPTGVPLGTSDITLDWTTMDTTALGTPFDPTSVTYVLVGHYTEKVLDLEKKFLDIQLIATELFETTMSVGTSVKLSDLKTKDGSKSFSGISAEGTWVVALQCGACRNPAPWYLSVLRQCNP